MFASLLGDCVLVAQKKEDKVSTPYKPKPYEIIDKNGYMITAQNYEGTVTRNSSSFKKVAPSLLQMKQDREHILDSASSENAPGPGVAVGQFSGAAPDTVVRRRSGDSVTRLCMTTSVGLIESDPNHATSRTIIDTEDTVFALFYLQKGHVSSSGKRERCSVWMSGNPRTEIRGFRATDGTCLVSHLVSCILHVVGRLFCLICFISHRRKNIHAISINEDWILFVGISLENWTTCVGH